jgi:formylglycine-generating enzyme required for sulfatase activity
MNQDGGGCGLSRTWDVCSKPAGSTAAGICDLAGNVWEWTQDWYHPSYSAAPTDGSAWVVPAGTVRATRGGGWGDHAWYMRATARSGGLPSFSSPQLGFRCAR